MVRDDVSNEYISIQSAKKDYSAIITTETLEDDLENTLKLRKKLTEEKD